MLSLEKQPQSSPPGFLFGQNFELRIALCMSSPNSQVLGTRPLKKFKHLSNLTGWSKSRISKSPIYGRVVGSEKEHFNLALQN